MRALALAVIALAILALVPTARGANFGAHIGTASGILRDPNFEAGALLADLDHWLPPTEPSTDTLAFAQGVLARAENTSDLGLWLFAEGWFYHLDVDVRFAEAEAAVLAAFPYTDKDVRLAFDALTLQEHPFPTDFDWVLNDTAILGLVQGGLASTDLAGVRAATDGLLHSTDLSAPGLALQLQAARAYAAFYPDRVANMAAAYDAFWSRTSADFSPWLPRLGIVVRTWSGGGRPEPTVRRALCPARVAAAPTAHPGTGMGAFAGAGRSADSSSSRDFRVIAACGHAASG